MNMSVSKGCGGLIIMSMAIAYLYFRAGIQGIMVCMAIVKGCFTSHIVNMSLHIRIYAGYTRIIVYMTIIKRGSSHKVVTV